MQAVCDLARAGVAVRVEAVPVGRAFGVMRRVALAVTVAMAVC